MLAQIFWAYSVSKVGPGRAGYFIYLAPVFGVILAVSLLGEQFRWFHAAGIALLIFSWNLARDAAEGRCFQAADVKQFHKALMRGSTHGALREPALWN
jgi:hypothetical protein